MNNPEQYTPAPWYNGTGPLGITGPNTPNTSGVTVGEAIAHRQWYEAPNGTPFPTEANMSIPISVDGQDTVAIAVGPNAKANAPLIAAAPDMLSALQLCRGNVASLSAAHPNIYGEWLKVIDATIAKAEGRTA